jgi:hypothetical protein
MHYMTSRSHQMQKYKFSEMCPVALFVESTVPPEHEKLCDHVSRPGRTGMHYVTHGSHRIKEHKFNVTCPRMLFMETSPVPLEHEK